MNGRQFALYLARDLHCCCGCVGREDTLVPNHRAGRGMGGSKVLDRPANVIVMCSSANGLIESNATWAKRARDYGAALEAAAPSLMAQAWEEGKEAGMLDYYNTPNPYRSEP